MNRSPLQRKGAKKRSQPKRDWTEARAKVEREGSCRLCGSTVDLEAAHLIGRKCDFYPPMDSMDDWDEVPRLLRGLLTVRPGRIVPLCELCHGAYDRHEVDLLPVVDKREAAQAVLDAGSLESARRRLAPSQYRKQAA
jgi:hypothetical protein